MGESRAPKPEHRLPEGEGSFYYAASSNRWVGAFEVPDDTGKRQRVAVSSRDEDTAWAKLQAKREQFPLPPNDSTTEGRPRHRYEKDAGPVSTTMYADTLKRLETQEGRCYYCRRVLVDGWVMDHKQPLARGGTNEFDNIAITCAKCNNTKGVKTEVEFWRWAAQTGFFSNLQPLEPVDNRKARMAVRAAEKAGRAVPRTPKRGHTLPEGAGAFYYTPSRGRWVGVIEAGWTATGKRRRLTVSSRDENTAWRKLQAKRKQILIEGIPAQGKGGTMTVAAWCKKYLEVRKRDLKPKPWASERSAIQKWVIPTVGHRKLADLNAGDIRALGDAVEAVNSATHARYCQRTLQTYLRGAVAEGHTVPTAALTAKKFAARVSPREALPLVAAAKVLEAAHAKADHSRWDAAFLQGLRQGEALGLTWDSVDLPRGTITVAWTLQELTQNDAGGYTVPPQYEARQLWGRFWLLEPKSAAAKREIPMTPQFRASLEEWRRNCPDSLYGLVWPRPNGKPRIAADDRAEFVALQAAAEVAKSDGSHYTVHEARHSTVSILLELGVAREVIERIVGHSELVEAYVSVSDARVVEALAALGNALHIEG